MKILWVPHTPTSSHVWDGNRQHHLFRFLSGRHDLHWITWEQPRRASTAGRWGRWTSAPRPPQGTEHAITLAPNFYRLVTRVYPRAWHLALNQLLFQRATRQISRAVRPDVIVVNSSHHWTGFPAFDGNAPVVFDHLDTLPAWVETRYAQSATAITTVSSTLAAAFAGSGKPVSVIANGVDLGRYQLLDRAQAKQKLNMTGSTVVSLIGLTCSPTLYFVDAFAAAQRKRPDLLLLIVGGGPTQEAIARRAETLGLRDIRLTGQLPSADVHWYFAATDVGLYPGEDVPYYRKAAPLKIVEYCAVGAQVISSPVDMFRQGWPNVHLTEPTAAAFEQAILTVLDNPRPAPNVAGYDWETLACHFDEVLEQALEPATRRGGKGSVA